MRPLFLAILMAVVQATNYSYIITVDPSDVQVSVVDDLKSKVKSLGGYITHEYTLIKGFSAELDDAKISGLQALIKQVELKTGCFVRVEKDSEVHTFAGHDH
ncbi:YHR138C [Zygosaccharomyces parabailii]|nr:YHR138C [Zygosaccharomyces parabailii]CDH09201.1 uncharacterized protein ZBAI_00985 [Zygosaccharomyces bailii ISA1307]